MLSLKKILLPVDFSDRSRAAAPYAKALATRFQSEVHLLHVEERPPYVGGIGIIVHPTGRAEHVNKLKSQLESLSSGEFDGLALTRDLVEGDPATKIVEYAKAKQVDLIMMPTHGYGPYRRFLLGSVTAKVLHDSDCPIWTATHIEEALPNKPITLRRIACAVDLGPHSEEVILWASSLGSALNAELLFIHVTQTLAPFVAEALAPDPQAELVRQAKEHIAILLNKLNVQGEIAIESGSVTEQIYKGAALFAADLLIIGRHAGKGIGSRLHPHAYTIIRESLCPVTSV